MISRLASNTFQAQQRSSLVVDRVFPTTAALLRSKRERPIKASFPTSWNTIKDLNVRLPVDCDCTEKTQHTSTKGGSSSASQNAVRDGSVEISAAAAHTFDMFWMIHILFGSIYMVMTIVVRTKFPFTKLFVSCICRTATISLDNVWRVEQSSATNFPKISRTQNNIKMRDSSEKRRNTRAWANGILFANKRISHRKNTEERDEENTHRLLSKLINDLVFAVDAFSALCLEAMKCVCKLFRLLSSSQSFLLAFFDARFLAQPLHVYRISTPTLFFCVFLYFPGSSSPLALWIFDLHFNTPFAAFLFWLLFLIACFH